MDNSAHKFHGNESPEIHINREAVHSGVTGLHIVQTVKGETTLSSGRFVNKQHLDMQTPQNPKQTNNEVVQSTAFFGGVQGQAIMSKPKESELIGSKKPVKHDM